MAIPADLMFRNVERFEIFRTPRTGKWQMVFHYRNGTHFHFATFDQQLDAVGVGFALIGTQDAPGPAAHCRMVYHDLNSTLESEIQDNSCRARQCRHNVNDSCILAARDTRLPAPYVDAREGPWSELHSIPSSCGHYQPVVI